MDSPRLIHAVDQIPDLRGAGIAYIGTGQCTFVRDSDHQSGLRTYVVFQGVERTGLSLVSAFPSSATRTTAPNQDRVASTVGTELRRAALDCGGVVFSAMLAGGSTLAVPVTSGFSSVGLAIASSALVATSLRCGMPVGRLWNAGKSPEANRILDNSEWYSVTGTVIDALDTADAAHRGLQLIGKYKALRKATCKPIAELLREHCAPIASGSPRNGKIRRRGFITAIFPSLGTASKNSEALRGPADTNGSGQGPVRSRE